MHTQIKETNMRMFAKPSILDWLKSNVYLSHADTVASIMQLVETVCKEARMNIAFLVADVQEQYAATVHHRGLKIMMLFESSTAMPSALRRSVGQIALLTAIPDGNMTEYIIAGRLIRSHKDLDTMKLRGKTTDSIEEGGGMDWDEFRLWLNVHAGKHAGESLRRLVESQLISKDLTNLPLRFRQGNYRRRATYSQPGCIKIDIVLPPDGDRLATIKILSEREEQPARREFLVTRGFEFEFNPEAFTKPEEASNMQVQQAEGANMMQAGKGLDYLTMYVPLDQVLTLTGLVEFLKANMPMAIVDEFDQHLKGLNVEDTFNSFRFKDVKHPDLEELLAGKESHGEMVFECGVDSVFTGTEMSFILGAVKKPDDTGWNEWIVGWPEGAKLEIVLQDKDEKLAQPKQPPRDEIRMSLFATNGNQRSDTDGLRKLSASQQTLSLEDFLLWFSSNATATQDLHTVEKVKNLIVNSAAMHGRHEGVERRFFITSIAHAVPATAFAGKTENSIKGSVDVDVVVPLQNRSGEFEQVGLFSFATIAKTAPNTTELAEFIDTYISPDHRGVTSVSFDEDQVYTFSQLSDMFAQYDKAGAQNLLQYQSSIRNLLRRLYTKVIGAHLYLKPVRASHPVLRGDGAVEPGVITFWVYDTYSAVDKQQRLLSFTLTTGLASDKFSNRYVEIIQGVECPAGDILKKRIDEGKDNARLETLRELGLSDGEETVEDDHTEYLLGHPANAKHEREIIAAEKTVGLGTLVGKKRATNVVTASYMFFMGTIQGVLPLLSPKNADRLQDFLLYVGTTYCDPDMEGEYEFTFDEGVELVIDVKEPGGTHLHFGMKL